MFKLLREAQLLSSSIKGDFKKVRKLVASGVDVTAKDKYDNTALHYAVDKGWKDIVVFLLDHGAEVNATNIEGIVPLHLACRNGEKEIAVLLIERGADINIIDKDYHLSSLHYAVLSKSKEIVKVLLANNVNIDIEDNYGLTPFQHALELYLFDIAEMFLSHGVKIDKLREGELPLIHAACKREKKEIVEFLLNHGADVNGRTRMGIAPLHFAAAQGNMDLVDFLIQKGSDINIKDRKGRTPFDYAWNNGCSQIMGRMIEYGALIGIAGEKPIFYAVNEYIVFQLKFETFIKELQHNYNLNKVATIVSSLQNISGKMRITSKDFPLGYHGLLELINRRGPLNFACLKCHRNYSTDSIVKDSWEKSISILAGHGEKLLLCPGGHKIASQLWIT